jgi:hypothetical protein
VTLGKTRVKESKFRKGEKRKVKKLLVSIAVALLAMLALGAAVFAADPIVSVDVTTPGGVVTVVTNGIDTSAWHLGSIGQTDTFNAVGGFTASYDAYAGNYGSLNTYVNASSGAGGATFTLNSYQNFDVLSANWNTHVIGNFLAIATGNDNQVAMNLKSIGSMYVWSEATNGGVGLRGNGILKEVWTTQSGVLMTDLLMSMQTTGIASISNSNIWGFDNRASGTLSSTNYGGGTRTVSATGTGTYNQTGYGANLLNFNGFNLPAGGSMQIIGNFVGGFSGTYTMDAK